MRLTPLERKLATIANEHSVANVALEKILRAFKKYGIGPDSLRITDANQLFAPYLDAGMVREGLMGWMGMEITEIVDRYFVISCEDGN